MNKKLFAKLFAIVLCVCVLCSLAIVFSSAASEDGTWTLVTDAGTLKAGDTIVIVAKDSNVAMSTAQGSNNRGQASVTKSGDKNTLTALDGAVQKITLEAGKSTGTFAFKTDAGYLYAASSSKNYLRSETTLSANSSWKITISNGAATVVAQGSYTRNTMKYNSQSSIFSCYSSGQQAIAIYRLETAGADACEHEWDDGVATTPATCTTDGQMTYTCTLCDETKTGVITAPGHIGGTATCTEMAVCETCGEGYGKLLDHNFENGVCTECDMEEPSELTIDFTTKDQRVSLDSNAQVWKNGNLIFTNNKASSTNAVADYFNPVRLYKGSSITIECAANITKIVFTANSNDHVTALSTAIGSAAVVDGKVVTVTLDGTSNTYTVALTAAQVQLYSVTVYYATAGAEVCDHVDTEKTTNTVGATCHKDGAITETCECGAVVSSETIPAAHTYANGVCSVCNVVEAPVTGVPYKFGMYQGNNNGVYYIDGSMVNTYYFGTSANASEGLNVYLEETESGYYLYTFVNGAKKYINVVVSGTHKNAVYEAAASTVYTVSKSTVYTTIDGSAVYFGTANNGTYNTVGTTSSTGFICEFYAAGDVDRITSAGVVLGTTLGMNFAVSVPAGVPTMTVEFAGKTYELTAKNLTDTTYQFSFRGIGPHQMAENIKATLLVDGVAVAELNNYSVEKNLKAILALDASLANIVNAVLAYGDAAENYNKIEGGVTAPETETEVEITEENNKLDLDNAEAFGFTAAGVNFDSDNKIYVKFYVVGEFKFYVNGEEVAIEKTEDGYYKFYTEALTATQFDDTFTFEIEVNGVKATLVYSVNTYAYSMQNDADMGELAKALYVYGIAAEDYAN